MSKKKRTREQKEKAQQRRMRELQYIQNNDKEEKVAESDKSTTPFPTLVNKQGGGETIVVDSIVNTDLRKVMVLIVLFALILVALAITESQYHYLTSLAKQIIDFLLSI